MKAASLAFVAAAVAPIAVSALARLDRAPPPVPAPTFVASAPGPAAPSPAPAAGATTPAAGATTPAAGARTAPAPPPAPTAAASADCLKRFADIALPAQRGDGAADGHTLICRRGYVLSFDSKTRDPDWVMEHLAPSDFVGSAKRSNKFGRDPLLGGVDADNIDYLKTGFDRGHQAPAGDAKFLQAIMDQSFFFSNMAPQIGIGFNRGAWKFLEETIRAWVTCGGHDDLYVITGPIYPTGPGGKVIGPDKVTVPVQFFKIVYDVKSGRAVGFVLPNRKIGSTIPDLQVFVKPIADIETETGLDFFRSFDMRRQAQLEGQAGTAWGHSGACTGDTGD